MMESITQFVCFLCNLYYYFWLYHVACRILVSPTRARTCVPYSGSVEPEQLDCQGSSHHPILTKPLLRSLGFPGGSVVKNLPASARDSGSIPR